MRREKNYNHWNPEAFALLGFALLFFVNMGTLPMGPMKIHVGLIIAHALIAYVWMLTYFHRSTQAWRRQRDFFRTWGPPVTARCPVCQARGDEPCDAGLHG